MKSDVHTQHEKEECKSSYSFFRCLLPIFCIFFLDNTDKLESGNHVDYTTMCLRSYNQLDNPTIINDIEINLLFSSAFQGNMRSFIAFGWLWVIIVPGYSL